MSAKISLIFCASAFILQTAYSQCLGRGIPGPAGAWPHDAFGPFDGFGPGWPGPGCGVGSAGFGPATGLAASYGGGLAVTSSSPIAPTGLTVTSENAIEGTVAVVGQLPFLGAVATDGAFASAGAGSVSYGCGDGFVGITAETPISLVSPALGYGTGPFNYGPGVGLKGAGPYSGCGCGAVF